MSSVIPIQVTKRRSGVFPAQFRLANQLVEIDTVERCWTELASTSIQRDLTTSGQYHFQVRCGDKRYRLSEDLCSGQWIIQGE